MIRSLPESLREWFMDFPGLSPGAFGADILPESAGSYAVCSRSDEPFRRYLDGSALCRCEFTFESREAAGQDAAQNLAVGRFYAALCAWTAARCRAGDFPVLPDGCQPVRLEPAPPPQAGAVAESRARWSLRFRLTYWRPDPGAAHEPHP